MTKVLLSGKHAFVMTKHVFCDDKTFVATKIFSPDKTFVETNICHDKHNSVATSILLSWQKTFCHDKHVFVVTKVCLLRQNFCRDKFICCDKYLSYQKFCHNKHVCQDKHNFVVTSIFLLRQAYFSHDNDNSAANRYRLLA